MEKSQLNVLSGKCYQKISVLSEILFGYFSSQAIDNSRLIKSHRQVESLDFFFFLVKKVQKNTCSCQQIS